MKKRVGRIGMGAVLFIIAILMPKEMGLFKLGAFLVAYGAVGYKVIWKALRGVINGQMLDENFLMSVASVGAFCLGEYPEAVAVMLFYQVGETFEEYAVGKSRRSIAGLMNIRPDSANLKTLDGTIQVKPSKVAIGDVIVIKPGEKIPLDGRVIAGASSIDMSALTGESLPREISEGDEVLSGSVNIEGLLEIEVTKLFGDSTVSKILDLVENAANKKAVTENFITRFAVVYTPLVVGAALLLTVIPPLFVEGAMWSEWIYRGLNFLVVSCPCALVISVPLSFFGGIGGSSRMGILVKGSNYLEAMAKAEYVVMDKTGTLTEGNFAVEKILPQEGFGEEEILKLAAMTEAFSTHPIAKSLREEYCNLGKIINEREIDQITEIAGKGVKAQVLGRCIAVGNAKLMAEETSFTGCYESLSGGTQVYIAVDGIYAGCIMLADKVKIQSKKAIEKLKKRGVHTVMLTGDSKEAGERTASILGIGEIYTELLPQDKVKIVEKLLKKTSPKGKVVFVGDGINDAPVLARADIGIAMGGLGADAAIEAADMVIMNDNPEKVAKIIDISAKTMRIVYENIVFALGVKIAVLILSALGIAGLWAAVFADVGVSVLAILNALRCLKQ